MKIFSFRFSANSLFSNPGISCIFVFDRNSLRKRQLKFTISAPDSCEEASVDLNTSSSEFISPLYDSMPLNPLIHPVNEKSVFPVYVMISSPIFKRPYESGNWFVPVYDSVASTVMTVSSKSIPDANFAEYDRFVMLSSLTYLSIFWIKSIGAPWYSWAI